MIQPTDKQREEAERIVGVKSQPVCGECQTRMTYGEGAPEAHIPPHWWCPQHPAAYVADKGAFATHEQQQLIDSIAALLSSRDAEIREVLEGLIQARAGTVSSVTKKSDTQHCWCFDRYGPREPHSDGCLAARGLWERVQSTNPRST